MIASLPMYAYPRTKTAEARFWAAIRAHLIEAGQAAPARLTRDPGDLIAHWQDPGLILSQTCGRPYRQHLHGRVCLVGTPDYGLDGCPPGYYRSLVVARAGDPRDSLCAFTGARFAYNAEGSQSGWAALAAEAPEVLTGPRLETGSHRASIRAIHDDQADFAAIDAVTWRHVAAASQGGGLKIVAATAPRPGLPFITAASHDPARLSEAILAALHGLDADDAERLGIRGLIAIPAAAYLALPAPRIDAA